MSQNSQSRSVRATQEGIEKVNAKRLEKGIAEGTKRWSQQKLADKAFVDVSTVKRFLKGDAVDRDSVIAITNALGLKPEEVINPNEWNPPTATPETEIDWQQTCRTMLESQRRMTSNPLMQEDSGKFDRDRIYVPLALVQRTKPEKRESNSYYPEAGTRLYEPQYEEKQRFEHQAFLTQILQGGEGKTKGKRIALIGEPGAGKTTLLQTIAFWLLDNNLGFPIWISLADLGQNGTFSNFYTYLIENWLTQAIPTTQLTEAIKTDFTNQIQQGKVWLLLDGVDEVAASGEQTLQAISRQLTGWIAASQVVLTCRLNVWQADFNALEAFETYRLLDFDYPEQVHQFIGNWFTDTGFLEPKAERLKTELKKTELLRLRDLVQNPLRLALLCSIWQNEEENLPETKAALYAQFVQQFYKWKPYAFPISRKEQRELNSALGRLALRDIDESGSRFRLRESFISEVLGEPDDEDSPFYKALEVGWLNQVGIAAESPTKEKVYAFFHPTFEEYFAASAIEDGYYFLDHVPHSPEQGTYRVFEPQWKEVIILWLGQKDEKLRQYQEKFIKELITFQEGSYHFYDFQAFFLAAAGIAEFRDSSFADLIVESLTILAFGYFNAEELHLPRGLALAIIEKARKVLRDTDRSRVINVLNQLLNIQDEQTKCHAALRLLLEYDSKNLEAIATLTELLKNSKNEYILGPAALGLLQYEPEHPKAIDTLYSLSKDLGTSQNDDISRSIRMSRIIYGSHTKVTYGLQFSQEGLFVKKGIGGTLIGPLQDKKPDSIKLNRQEFDDLLYILRSSRDVDACCQAIYSLRKLDEYGRLNNVNSEVNKDEIYALIDLVRRSTSFCSSLNYFWQILNAIMYRLDDFGEIILNHLDSTVFDDRDDIDTLIEVLADALIKVVCNCIDLQPDFYITAVYWLGIVGIGKLDAIKVLVEVVNSSTDDITQVQAIKSLQNTLRRNGFPLVITGLKHYLKASSDEINHVINNHCYELFWHCAQNMSYPAFYKALHNPNLLPYQNKQDL